MLGEMVLLTIFGVGVYRWLTIGKEQERTSWNKGNCTKCNGKWVFFIESKYGKIYKCRNCNKTVEITWPSVIEESN